MVRRLLVKYIDNNPCLIEKIGYLDILFLIGVNPSVVAKTALIDQPVNYCIDIDYLICK